jgi:hypothetical protein
MCEFSYEIRRSSVVSPFLCRCGIILDAGAIYPPVNGFLRIRGVVCNTAGFKSLHVDLSFDQNVVR